MGGAAHAPPNACWDAAKGRVHQHDSGSGDGRGDEEGGGSKPAAHATTHLRVGFPGQKGTRAELQGA